jgi:2-methylisocitrate lyase-like PEP mutase family enzyme
MEGKRVATEDMQSQQAERFLASHRGNTPLLLPNPWDLGSARLLEWLGFEALATTSSGYAAALGRLDGSVARAEAIAHASQIVGATHLPVSADLENGFSDDPAGVAETIRLALQAGLAGCSIEDFSGKDDDPIYAPELAAERVRAASEIAHAGPVHLVLTGRAENYLHGNPDLADTIGRLQLYGEAGADVLYAPGLTRLDDISTVVRSVDRPVNVLLRPGGPSVAELTAVGVHRISVGGAFAFAALGALVEAAHELQAGESATFLERARVGGAAAQSAFEV